MTDKDILMDMHGDAMELMKVGHKRVRENMEKHTACTPEGRTGN